MRRSSVAANHPGSARFCPPHRRRCGEGRALRHRRIRVRLARRADLNADAELKPDLNGDSPDDGPHIHPNGHGGDDPGRDTYSDRCGQPDDHSNRNAHDNLCRKRHAHTLGYSWAQPHVIPDGDPDRPRSWRQPDTAADRNSDSLQPDSRADTGLDAHADRWLVPG